MSEIKNAEHLSRKDKENLQYFFEEYSLAWYIEKEYKRLQDKTYLEQQSEKGKEMLGKIESANESLHKNFQQKSTLAIHTLRKSIFEVSDMIRVFTKPTGQFINIYDGFIEYEKTGDEIKVATKIGSNIIGSSVMIAGGYASFKMSVAAAAASSVFLTPIGGAIVGIAVFVAGIGTSYWISDNFGTAINTGVNGVIDFIRETDFTFNPSDSRFIEYDKLDNASAIHLINTAHCHQTFEKRNRQIFLRYVLGDIYKKQIFINNVNVTEKMYPNNELLQQNIYWMTRTKITDKLTPEQLEKLSSTIERLKRR